MSTKVHKVFVSSYSEDNYYREKYLQLMNSSGFAVSRSVPDGILDGLPTETIMQKIRDEYISDSTVTVVLVGKNTWRRKYVDWEIHATIRDTPNSPRGGLLGILLPTYTSDDSHTMPPRLAINFERKYAKLCRWTEDPTTIQRYIDDAFDIRNNIHVLPSSTYPLFAENRNTGDRWQ